MDINCIKWIATGAFGLAWGTYAFLYNRLLARLPVPEGSTLGNERIKFWSFWFAGLGVIASVLLTTFNSLEATLITRENGAGLRRDESGNYHIVTKYDVIQALGA